MIDWGDDDRRREFDEAALVHLDALSRTALGLTHSRVEREACRPA